MFEDFVVGGNGEEVAQSSEINDTEIQGGTADDTEGQGSGTLNNTGVNGGNVADSQGSTAGAQSKETNAQFAAARRDAEAKTRAMANRMNALAKSQGFNSFEEFEHHLKEAKINELGKKLYDTYGVDADEVKPFIDDMVSAHPDVIKAREALELSRQQEAQHYVDAEIAKVKEIDPSINSFEDILALENFADIEELLNKNYTISDAYKIANFNKLMDNNTKRSAQEVRNSIGSKGHLSPTKDGGAGDTVIVPEDVKEQYKIFNPGITDDEIARDYKRSLERK